MQANDRSPVPPATAGVADPVRSRRFLAGRVLLGVAALAAVAAVAAGITAVAEAGSDTVAVETWRAAGFAVFAGIFALLAWRPRGFPGLLELAIAHKVVVAAVVLAADGAGDAVEVALADATLAIVLLAAYVLCRSWRAWTRPAPAAGS